MSEMVHITINKQPLEVPAGTRIIEAAKMLNIDIPHLCYHPDQTIKAHCRMCMVEVVGSRKLTAACSTVVWEGMEVITDSKKVYDAQTGVLDLILSDHKTNCLSCARNGSCLLYTSDAAADLTRAALGGSEMCIRDRSCPTSPPTSRCASTTPPSSATPPSASSAAAA